MALPLILIVDDNPENLTVLGELLQPDHAVRVANSGVRALRLARLRPLPDLVLLDVMMPEMDGYEVLQRLRAAPETAAIPVIFLSALTDPAEQQRGLQQGAAAFVTKPVEPAPLLAQVHRQLAGRPAAGPPVTGRQAGSAGPAAAAAAKPAQPASPHALRIGRHAAQLARQLSGNAAWALDAASTASAGHTALPWDGPAPLVGHLQEHWDGSGYPAGLSGAAIPLPARLWALADAWDRLDGLPAAQRQRLILAERGRRFDPAAVDALIAGLPDAHAAPDTRETPDTPGPAAQDD